MISAGQAWTLIAALVFATVALKAVGPIAAGGRALPPRLASVIAVMPAALLSALVVTSTLVDENGNLGAGADAAGVLAGSAVVWRTGKVLHAVVVAAAVAAALRGATG